MLFFKNTNRICPILQRWGLFISKKKLFYGHFHKNKKEKKKPHNTIIQSITNYYSGF